MKIVTLTPKSNGAATSEVNRTCTSVRLGMRKGFATLKSVASVCVRK